MVSRFRDIVLVALAAAVLLPVLALAADEIPAEPVPVDATRPAPAVEPAPLSPMMKDIVAAWDAHTVVVAALERQVAQTADASTALALQHQIEAARAQVEIQILTIQAQYARREGRLDVAAEIESAIAELTSPRPRGIPIERARGAN
jgi:hypothetical protein